MFTRTPILRAIGPSGAPVVARRRLLGALSLAVGLAAMALSSAPSSAAAYRPEQSLMGIRIFEHANAVLKKYGNPTRIITGSNSTNQTPSTNGPDAAPGAAPGALPALPQGGAALPPPPEFGGGQQQQQPQNGQPNEPAVPPTEVIWEYSLKGNITLDFTLSNDGRVIQISVSGLHSAAAATARGIRLGSLYTAVLAKYGYPESQDTNGSILTALFAQRSHVAFQFLQNKVVSITVAAVE